jgi:hypothetical protein
MTDLLAGLFVVTIVYVMVRPRSKAGELVDAFGSALTAIVRNAADLAE